MRNPELDFSANQDGSSAPSGWRLHRLEMANWGTFGEGRIHVIAPDSGWSLLVGENGSGKSTVVDALRTLLVPRRHLRYSFNDAAGGQKKQDRSLMSYIRGAWSASRDEGSADTQTRYLRKEEEPSFLLAVFRNLKRNATLSLAQILWVSNGKDNAHFLVGNGEKNILADLQLAGAGRELMKKLRERGWTICEGASYREEFCERMGIPGDGALEIFNQAIGVKEVGDVNAFLRRHLLAMGEAEEIIRERVVPQFANLDDCWKKIETAEKQIVTLAPIVAAQARVVEAEKCRAQLRELLDVLPLHYARRHEALLTEHITKRQRELDLLAGTLNDVDTRMAEEQQRRDSLRTKLDADKIGQRIKELEVEMKELDTRVVHRRRNHDQLSMLLAAQGLEPMPTNDASFLILRERAAIREGALERERTEARERESQAGLEKARTDEALAGIRRELERLRRRRCLIPERLQELREAICKDTGVTEDELLFAGELMEVKPEHAADWAGVIERLLHNFGISLLVPEHHYQRVAPWVNGRRLVSARGEGLRLEFHSVPTRLASILSPPDDSRAVVLRLNFRDEHPIAGWVEAEVRRSFRHLCCRDTAELERENFGITAQGLIRSATRHVKDDRRAVQDRSQFVLGWSPEVKIHALEEECERLTALHTATSATERAARETAKSCDVQLRALESIGELKGFPDIDFQTEQDTLARLADEKRKLEEADDQRKELKRQLDATETSLKTLGARRDELLAQRSQCKWQCDTAQSRLTGVQENLTHIESRDIFELEPRFAEVEDQPLSYDNVPEVREAVRRTLTGRLSRFSEEVNAAQRAMIGPMKEFLLTWPEESKGLREQPEYAPDFTALHERLVTEDLPAHKERFRDFLNDNLTQSIGTLEDRLVQEVKAHESRLQQVNETLAELDYSPGTFVVLDSRPTRDAAIRAFRSQLRDCLGMGLQGDEHARLTLYGKIREIVTRFTSDFEWTAHVADSRRWLDLGVRVQRRADGVEVDYLESGGGKSGGQKAKLAFTILAASLLAQYGLADDPARPDSLRLVVVDEVFARTDEENSRRALELFERMGFQLLVVVPWEAKARIAESFVQSFHLTLNSEGKSSQVQIATRAQYEKARTEADERPA